RRHFTAPQRRRRFQRVRGGERLLLPFGKAAWATRAVATGTTPSGSGFNDMATSRARSSPPRAARADRHCLSPTLLGASRPRPQFASGIKILGDTHINTRLVVDSPDGYTASIDLSL